MDVPEKMSFFVLFVEGGTVKASTSRFMASFIICSFTKKAFKTIYMHFIRWLCLFTNIVGHFLSCKSDHKIWSCLNYDIPVLMACLYSFPMGQKDGRESELKGHTVSRRKCLYPSVHHKTFVGYATIAISTC